MSLLGPSAARQDPLGGPGGHLGGWRAYLFAVLSTLATLGLRLAWSTAFGQRPLMILFMLPIIVSAFLGGLGPGLLATGLSALLLVVFLVPPTHSLAVASLFDLAQLSFLMASGVLVSVLAGALLRSRAKEAAATAELQAALEEDMAAHRALGVSENSRQILDALYRGLMETTPAGCFVTDGEWRIILVNQAYVQRSGYGREELLAMRVPDLAVDPGDAPYRRIQAEGQVRFETRHRARSGEIWPVEVVASFSPMEGGRCFVFCQDITERVAALETVRSMEHFNRAILDSVNAHLVVLDPRGVILAVNAPWKLFGRSRGLGQGAEVGDDYLAACERGAGEGAPGAREALEGIRAVQEGRLPGFTLEYPCDSPGERLWFTMNVTPLGNSGGGVVITHLDNTARNRMEMALVESEKRFQDIASASSDWFWEMDREGRYTYASESVAKVLGWTPAEMTGRSVLDGFAPADRPGMEARYQRLFSEARGFRNLPAAQLRKDGTLCHLLTSGTPLLDEAGALKGFRGLDRDVTDVRAAEEQQRRLEGELVQAQKLESIGRLAGGVAHDFNNMLGVILGQAEVAMMMPGSQPFHPYLGEIIKAARRSGDLTRQLLAFARRQVITPRVLDLNETIQGMLKMLGRLIGEDITLAWMRKEGLWTIRMDPSQIDQILANLAVNARDAILGVGRVSIALENVHVDRDFLREHPEAVEGDFVALSVADTGCGMDPEVIKHIFEPFFTTKAIGKGTGLGLATVHGIVKQNEGFILVESRPGQGTRFRIYLPRHQGPEAGAGDGAAPAIPAGHGETILLVEDEATVLVATRMLLEHLGYAVLPAQGAAKALEIESAFQGSLDLLLTDVVMPDMNGRELSDRIRSRRPGLPVLFMSGYTADILDPHGVLEEGVHFLQKPASVLEMAHGVEGALGRRPRV